MARKVSFPKKWLFLPIEVEWEDHVGHGPEWTAMADVKHEPATFTTVGYLLNVTPGTVTLGSTLDEERTTTGDCTVLVRSCVKKAKSLI
jgi:hypothetical protein